MTPGEQAATHVWVRVRAELVLQQRLEPQLHAQLHHAAFSRGFKSNWALKVPRDAPHLHAQLRQARVLRLLRQSLHQQAPRERSVCQHAALEEGLFDAHGVGEVHAADAQLRGNTRKPVRKISGS